MASNSVYLKIVDFFASSATPQAVEDFQPSPAVQQRALELLDVAKQDRLNSLRRNPRWSTSPSWELEHILRMAKARARQILAAQR
jgi:hypothetical protein